MIDAKIQRTIIELLPSIPKTDWRRDAAQTKNCSVE